jgi:hypothetical protein
VAVERHLVGCSRLRDGVHADRAYPVPVKEVARSRENALTRRQLRSLWNDMGNDLDLGLLSMALDGGVTGQYTM